MAKNFSKLSDILQILITVYTYIFVRWTIQVEVDNNYNTNCVIRFVKDRLVKS